MPESSFLKLTVHADVLIKKKTQISCVAHRTRFSFKRWKRCQTMVAKKQTEMMTFYVIDENHLNRSDFFPPPRTEKCYVTSFNPKPGGAFPCQRPCSTGDEAEYSFVLAFSLIKSFALFVDVPLTSCSRA